MNILTFDLEDWYQLTHRRVTGELPPARDTVLRQTDLLLELLNQRHTRATFFVLGVVAERFPALLRRIIAQGHEVASHGYAHQRVEQLSRAQFEYDVRRSREILEGIAGQSVRGYRAPEFSIRAQTLWALDALAAAGYHYDSSIFPIHHRRYGVPGFCPRPARYALPSGHSIVELPPATLPVARFRIPVAGGGYFRMWPLWLLRRAAQWHQAQQLPMTAYFHPYEFDTLRLNVFDSVPTDGWKRHVQGCWINWRHNVRRAGVTVKLSAVLREFRFTTCQEYLNVFGCRENRTLLQPARTTV